MVWEPTIQPEEISTIEEEHKEKDKLITTKPNEVAINEDEMNTHSFDFIDCPIIEFIIKPEEEEEIYIIDFETCGIGKCHYLGRGNVKIWKIKEEQSKVKRSKMSNSSRDFFKFP